MRFVRFEIENFKGISSAVLDLKPAGGNVYTLIGLNESGKTTVLEAIDDFGIAKERTEALYGAKRGSAAARFIPKHLEASFTGDITVKALVEFEGNEVQGVIESVNKLTGCLIEKSSVPDTFEIVRGYKFENSDFKSPIHTWSVSLAGKKSRNKKSKEIDLGDEVGKCFVEQVSKLIPRVIYFPTFLFSIPEKIVLNPVEGRESDVNRHYRQIIQDVASSLQSPLDIKTHIVDRILTEKTMTEQFLAPWLLGQDKEKQINATLNALSAHLTKTVFDSWGKIFSGNFTGRELLVRLGIDNEGDGKRVTLKFVLKEGQQEYDVSERSLGFRWFFSFLLFTYYRVFAKGRGATLFLLDEPASNLHSRAQTQLLDSFARIADGPNGIMYSTHSHYMINPEWLDQAFVVANRAIDYDHEVGLPENKPTEVVVERYRKFVGKNPDKTTYFQPVLDKLAVVPSRLDLLKPSVLVEGKGDYYILEYGRKVLLDSRSEFAIVPTRGAAGMDELVGLFLGWGIDFCICLDADKAGKAACKKYEKDWALTDGLVFTLDVVDPALINGSIENFLSPPDEKLIASELSIVAGPSKSQIQLFFSEALAKKKILPFSKEFKARIAEFDRIVSNKLGGSSQTLRGPRNARRAVK